MFLVAASGEAVKHYGDLLDKQHAYSLATWTDRYSGRSKLTYQEALALEKIAEKQLRAQVPTRERCAGWCCADPLAYSVFLCRSSLSIWRGRQ
jgi:hypothetical protein